MRSIKINAGIVIIDNLQTASKANNSLLGWFIELHYSNKKDKIALKCKSEEEADEGVDQIFTALNEGPTSGTITFSR